MDSDQIWFVRSSHSTLTTLSTGLDLKGLALMLLQGYYNMCQKQYQHRDLSIGNVLMVDEAIQSKPFETSNPNEVQTEILKICGELKIDTQCHGFVIDGDMAVDWRNYFSKDDIGVKAGTAEFMSDELLRSGRKDMHSPLDDYHSLYDVAQWACYPEYLQLLRRQLSGDRRADATHLITSTRKKEMEFENGMILLDYLAPNGDSLLNPKAAAFIRFIGVQTSVYCLF
ncbi:hypothetical protein BDP27DRAFT_1422217 [Rhodocollybia butyracea]|uniref:Fungal-type protein kinase domain-containing protein n=1 Tax=Rhodocollybia butyracea TaxID=206335 RepID=A0A9P5PRT7_9AGAR|nr:hypothetical protein BDP27DRAFT_1422217 [Rhodocollybia butyracea]